MKKILIATNSAGRITTTLEVFNPPPGAYEGMLEIPENPPLGSTHYRNGEFLGQPAQPSPDYDWDDAQFVWLLNLTTAKTSAKDRITKARDTDELNGFEAYGKTFDSDVDSQRRILIASATAQGVGASFSIDWTCADNSVITLGYEQMIGLPALMAIIGDQLHQKARTLKAQIDAATTLAEIESAVW